MEEVLPEIVKIVPGLPVISEDHQIEDFQDELKGISYGELIPYLIGAIQTQQSQLDALSQELAACCAADPDARSGAVEDDIRMESLPAQNRLEQNSPNPFQENTTLRFTLGAEKHTRVCIYNSNGQLIDCLVDETRSAGNHRVDWQCSDLAPGIYFYSLEVDGFEQVRRAVKL